LRVGGVGQVGGVADQLLPTAQVVAERFYVSLEEDGMQAQAELKQLLPRC
jgi:hypothetical protein